MKKAHWGNQSGGEVRAHLYRDGRHYAESKIPALFPVAGGESEVAMSGFGIKRCHYVTSRGEFQLVPDPRSAEGKRARLDREHPTLSRVVGLASIVLLIIGLALLLLQVAEPLSRIPPVTEAVSLFQPDQRASASGDREGCSATALTTAAQVTGSPARRLHPHNQAPELPERQVEKGSVGVFHSPVQLPIWLNITLGVGAAVASTERALRLRYSWLDSAGN
ncbi:hypothetical protein [Pseudonocardia sp. HH130630-07]|uniref:hypothetical protein n=1 Tax=Pseudonocardia sp. HH130630-07 TaxID=1690815 RepID=UPI000839BA4B|nr:hypothetical protein [Pseudonocardia sp. HH130630-07]